MRADQALLMAAAIIDDRASERDVDQERSMARTVRTFNALTGHELTTVDGWMFMVCLKAARSYAGEFKADDYLDGASYFALAYEEAEEQACRQVPSGRATTSDRQETSDESLDRPV